MVESRGNLGTGERFASAALGIARAHGSNIGRAGLDELPGRIRNRDGRSVALT